MFLSVTVIIVTLDRPDCVRRCLDCLFAQAPRPSQIIVVDASPDNRTREVVEEFCGVLYLRNENGYGRMTASRNIGLLKATGDIIAFLDDDAFAHSDWLENLLETYSDATVGAVGGRALNNQPGEEMLGVNEIGQLKPNGTLTGYFAADPGKIIEVDHVMGCNMSFRREVIAQLGGFREDYPGISGVREDSDMCMRVKALGYKILFNPAACVEHIGAPQAKGQRFDTRYAYYGQRNHHVLLIRNFGFGSPLVWRYMIYSIFQYGLRDPLLRIFSGIARFGVILAGSLIGVISGISLLLKTGRNPVRSDRPAKELAKSLKTCDDNKVEALSK